MSCTVIRADGSTQELALEQADSLWPRLKGLLGRRSLAPTEGIWIRPCNSVHSLFMAFSIDVIYLNGSGHIIAIRPSFSPWRMSLCLPAKSVVELATGECQRLHITIGDQIKCES